MCECNVCIFIKREPAFFSMNSHADGLYFFFLSKDKVVLYLDILRASFVLSFACMEADSTIIVIIWSDLLCCFYAT